MKEFLHARGVTYQLRNVSLDSEARTEFLAFGFRLPPVVVTPDGAVEGFDPAALDRLLFGEPLD